MVGTGSDFCRGSGGLFGAWSVEMAFSNGGFGLSSVCKYHKYVYIVLNNYNKQFNVNTKETSNVSLFQNVFHFQVQSESSLHYFIARIF